MKTVPKRHVCGELVFHGEHGYHHRFDREGEMPPMKGCPVCGYPLNEDWFRPLYKVEPMTRQMMESTISGDKHCSNCWGFAFQIKDTFVTTVNDEGEEIEDHLYYVLCSSCLEETQGYVTAGYIGFCRRKDFEDYGNSMISLADVLGIRKYTHREKGGDFTGTILQELGL